MTVKVLQGAPPVAITLRRSARARRITLRVSGIDNRVTLTMPRGVSEAEAMAFAAQKEPWIRTHLSLQAEPEALRFDAEVPFEGELLRIVEGHKKRPSVEAGALFVKGPEVGARVLGFFKAEARDRCAIAADYYSERLGLPYTGLTMRDTRSRWGSCTSAGRLMLSWRLIMAPPDVLRYVVAHEVAHLAEMNHGPAFWQTVEAIYGPCKLQKSWLTNNGASLHRVRFTD